MAIVVVVGWIGGPAIGPKVQDAKAGDCLTDTSRTAQDHDYRVVDCSSGAATWRVLANQQYLNIPTSTIAQECLSRQGATTYLSFRIADDLVRGVCLAPVKQ